MSMRAKQVFFGYIQTQSLYAALKLGVPDALAGGPRTAADLAAELGADADALGRLLDVLCKLGIFAHAEGGAYQHNEASHTLISTHKDSLADLFLFCGVESYRTFGGLVDAVRTGEGVFEDAWGGPFWKHLQQNPERGALFGRAMERQSEALLQKLASDFGFGDYPHIVDVGGGKGQLFRPLVNAGVSFRGTVMDQPMLTELAAGFLAEEGLDNCEFVGGSFFESVPAEGDLYILKFVLHDWQDAQALAILETVKRAMKPGSKLMVIELFLGGDPSPWSYLSDMLMLSTFGARERSDAQFRDLLDRGGFDVDEIQHIAGAHYYVLASPRA